MWEQALDFLLAVRSGSKATEEILAVFPKDRLHNHIMKTYPLEIAAHVKNGMYTKLTIAQFKKFTKT